MWPDLKETILMTLGWESVWWVRMHSAEAVKRKVISVNGVDSLFFIYFSYYYYYYFFMAMLLGMWDFSSPSKTEPMPLAGKQSPNLWATRAVPSWLFLELYSPMCMLLNVLFSSITCLFSSIRNFFKKFLSIYRLRRIGIFKVCGVCQRTW